MFRLLRGESVAGGQVAADVPEFLQVDLRRALGDFGAERRIAARAAAAGDAIGALRRLGQRKELPGPGPGVVDKRRVDAMIGVTRKTEARLDEHTSEIQ